MKNDGRVPLESQTFNTLNGPSKSTKIVELSAVIVNVYLLTCVKFDDIS